MKYVYSARNFQINLCSCLYFTIVMIIIIRGDPTIFLGDYFHLAD